MTTATVARPDRHALSSRWAWAAVLVVIVAALAVGSVHSPEPSAQARISALDSDLKCPSCYDLSIAQSQAPLAVDLRQQVALWVGEGRSNTQIEQAVVARYGPGELLVPSGSSIDALLWIVPIAVLGIGALGVAGYLWRRRRLPPGAGPVAP